ncbi:MAG TPA: patatin-like phospholipase family protein, partial [Steroidobacteraceae bacterium]|nr:patatin-like phospholipase family protein [Steroidobacteraceae bacterium]
EQVINQSLGPQLLRVLDDGNDKKEKGREPDFIDYPADDIVSPLANTERRYIALHGAGRLAVVATHKSGRLFHTYRGGELFSVLASNADVIEQRCPQFKNLNARITEAAHDIERRIRLYFNLLNLCVLILLGSLLWYAKDSDSYGQMMPVVTAQLTPKDTSSSFDLAQALQKQSERQRPAYIVAASGGGTRAAVYTASALRGMAQAGLSEDIVLMSGVSGGGVALAYYAMHKPKLGMGASFDAAAWARYRDGMAEPFIQDVLEGSMEWRIAGNTPLSALLVESFHRRLTTGDRTTFAEIGDVGLILNTSITGHPASDSILVGNAMDANTQHIDEHDCLPFARMTGQRLSFSNISDTHRFPQPAHSRLPDIGFAFVVVNDPAVELVQAAALNANFPPVFPNARVDLLTDQTGCGGRRTYHVTDGGATENLGLISALYALQSTLDTLIAQKAQDPSKAIALPELHIVALEASAIGVDYSQDRGIGTATGGSKERLAGGLTEQLIAGIELQATMLNGRATPLHLHYVALPTAFRSRGGVGTHWMLPNYVTITNPHLPHAPEWWAELPPLERNNVHARLGKQALFALLDELHDPAVDFCSRERAGDSKKTVAAWICGADPGHPTAPDLHVTEWRKLIQKAQ